MALRDEIREQREHARKQGKRAYAAYLLYYYKYYLLGAAVLLLLLGSLVRDLTGRRETVLQGILLNSGAGLSDGQQVLEDGFGEYLGLDTKHQQVSLDTSLQFDPEDLSQFSLAASQRIAALAAGNDIDFLMADRKLFLYYVEAGAYQDLREILPEQLLEQYRTQNRLVEVDGVPLGIQEESCPWLLKAGCYRDTVPIIGVVQGSAHTQETIRFLEFLEEEAE